MMAFFDAWSFGGSTNNPLIIAVSPRDGTVVPDGLRTFVGGHIGFEG